MNSTKELSKMKVDIIENVKVAAQQGDLRSISKWSKAAQQCESLIAEASELHKRIQELSKSFFNGNNDGKIVNNYQNIGRNGNTSKNLTAKQQAAEMRASWVTAMCSKGIVLNGHGRSYKTKEGKSVGIAFANELNKPPHKDKWFLGLRDEPTHIVVLLCRDLSQNVHDIVLPVSQLGQAWSKLSRSSGEIKFHVHRRNGNFFLFVNKDEPLIKVSDRIGNYQPLVK